MNQNRTKFPTLLNLIFLSSALLALIFILSEYKVSQSESELTTHETIHTLQTAQQDGDNADPVIMYPPPWKLMDLEVQYVLNNLVCNSSNKTESKPNKSIFMIVIITSHAGDFQTRNHLRRILPKSELERMYARRLFLLAQPNPAQQNSKYNEVHMDQIIEENRVHEDILMGNFLESYKNLTYKHLMGLQWIERYCSQATFVIKQDDDIFVDFYQIENVLKSNKTVYDELTKKYTIWGKILSRQPVIRDPKSKWFVSAKEIPSMQHYPPFVSGWGYVTTPKVVKEIVHQASKSPFFWIDDALLTGIIREKIQVNLMDSSSTFTIYKGQMQCCIASPHKQYAGPFWCDYLVGPTNGDMQLLEILQNHARFCHTAHLCRNRSPQRRLNDTCVVTENMIVNNFEDQHSNIKPSVNAINAQTQRRGSWKIVKL